MSTVINGTKIDVSSTPDRNIVMVNAKNDLLGFKMEQIQKDIWSFKDRVNTPPELLEIEKEISDYIVNG